MKFRCGSCGRDHTGLPEIAYSYPFYYFTVPAEDRDRRCDTTTEYCIIDNEDRFIRGVLSIPIRETEQCYSIGAWMSVSERNLNAYLAFQRAECVEPPWMTGYLSNELEGFPSCLELVVGTQPTAPERRPLLTISPGSHPLGKLQSWGITLRDLVLALDPILHEAEATDAVRTATTNLANLSANLPAWPFEESSDQFVLASREAVAGTAPILRASRRGDDRPWHFLARRRAADDTCSVSLRELVVRDPSIAELAALPVGWSAWRASSGGTWQFVKPAAGENPAAGED